MSRSIIWRPNSSIRVKSLLIDEFGIDPKRVLLCRPRMDEGAAMPRVEILL
jgi:hypothetical protein